MTGVLDTQFLRVDGFRPSPRDVRMPQAAIRKYDLRRGDTVSGTVSDTGGSNGTPKHFNVDTVNGLPANESPDRPHFYDLTPLYPQERIRLETEPHLMTTRVVDLVAPIGKGQRALIVSPPKAGKTMVLQAIARAIAVNHPQAHVMALLIDERPEEVTDMQRTLRGEVIASTFDRPPKEHTEVAELAVERAKRLVEMGQDVVILLDSITRLGRAHNLAAPGNGRIMSGGIEAGALHAPKRFLGAARNVENGGSLTIIATALIETGSLGDTVIFEEFKSTGNAELRLLRGTADRRIFPAVDVDASGTRRDDLLLAPEELELTRRLRRALSALEPHQAIEHLLEKLSKTGSNAEFLYRLGRP